MFPGKSLEFGKPPPSPEYSCVPKFFISLFKAYSVLSSLLDQWVRDSSSFHRKGQTQAALLGSGNCPRVPEALWMRCEGPAGVLWGSSGPSGKPASQTNKAMLLPRFTRQQTARRPCLRTADVSEEIAPVMWIRSLAVCADGAGEVSWKAWVAS